LFGGESLECEFINRHWYWIQWDNKRNDRKGCYTFNPTFDYIIAPKEYELETKEDHYQEPTESEENLDQGDKSSKESESSKDTDSSKGKGKEHTPVARSPIERLAESLGEYIATKETQLIV